VTAQHIKERREGESESFTGDELLHQRRKAEAAAQVGLVLGRGRESVQERKGRNEGVTRVLYGQRDGRESGRGLAAGSLAIDAWRAKRHNEHEKGENSK
jgi:hypothetical protein